MANNKQLEDLNVTQSEIQAIAKALEKEEFRKLFAEYAEEISNPENKKKYEEEITLLEQERGMNVQFIHPEPGYVMKTTENGEKKAFINVCKNKLIGQPSSRKEAKPDGKMGLGWSIPHSFTPPREDTDKNGIKCAVYDVVVHPDTYRMAETNNRFQTVVNDIALDGIEKQFGIKLDRKNVTFPKLKYKGTPTATIIRSKNSNSPAQELDPHDPLSRLQYPYDSTTTEEKSKQRERELANQHTKPTTKTKITKPVEKIVDEVHTVPKHSIVYQSERDIQDFVNSPVLHTSKSVRPSQLIVNIELPLLQSADTISLDVLRKEIKLQCDQPAKYKLELSLPYEIDENSGSAKFDKNKRKLVLTLPVIPEKPVLIEELTSSSLVEDVTQPLSEETESNSLADELAGSEIVQSKSCDESAETAPSSVSSPTPAVHRLYPSYQYFQNNETVSVVINVENVTKESVKTFFSAENASFSCQFDSMGSGCFPMSYGLVIKFAENCRIKTPASKCIRLSPDNVVLLFEKDCDCLGPWSSLWVGSDVDHLEEKLFPTENNFVNAFAQLDAEISQSKSATASNWNVEVTEMNKESLCFEMRRKKAQSAEQPPEHSAAAAASQSCPNGPKAEKDGKKKHVHFAGDDEDDCAAPQTANADSVAASGTSNSYVSVDNTINSHSKVTGELLEPSGPPSKLVLPDLDLTEELSGIGSDYEQLDGGDDTGTAGVEDTIAAEVSPISNHVTNVDELDEDDVAEPQQTVHRPLVEELAAVPCTPPSSEVAANGKNDFTPETMLTWDKGVSCDEHKTKCSIEFTNSAVFDLDTD